MAGKEGWIAIQQRVFTNWTNDKLKPRNLSVADLVKDLENGVILINLAELLVSTAHKQEKSAGKYTKDPKLLPQRLENTSKGLKFLTDDGVKFVNIGNEDIVNGNQKLILGLIWTLIQKYQISLGDTSGKAPKAALLDWVNGKLKGVGHAGVTNFNKDWNSGVAVCALANACGAGVADWKSLSPNNGASNAQKGIDAAQQNLAVPAVLSGADLANPEIDELSVMTYVSYYKLAPPGKIAPAVAKPSASTVVAKGPGLVGGKAGNPATFDAVQSAPKGGELTVTVDGPKDPAEAKVTKKADGEWACEYLPKLPGVYKVNVKLDGEHVPNSPFTVTIGAGLLGKVTPKGPGLEGGYANQPAHFDASQEEPRGGELTVKVDGPKDPAEAKVKKNADQTWYIEYLPKTPGVYTVNVKLDKDHVVGSPYKVTIASPGKVTAAGPGLEKGLTAGAPAKFSAKQDDPVVGELTVVVTGPKDPAPAKVTKNGNGAWDCEYTPQTPGNYVVNVYLDNAHVQGSPFKVNIPEAAKVKKGPSLGYENKIVGFYSTTTSSQEVRSDQQALQTLLVNKGVHLRPDFVPWTPVDVDMTKEFRDKLFEKANGNRKMPMLFIDDEYIGSYKEVQALEEAGKLDALLAMK